MNNLIETFKNDDGVTVVDGRSLYEFLEIDSNYVTWFERMTEYGFEEETDFIPFLEESTGGRRKQNHALTMDMAKELSMIQRTDRGKQARQYFISMEQKAIKQAQLPTTPNGKIQLLLESSGDLYKGLETTNKRIDELEQNQSLAPGEYNFISKEVSKAVYRYIELHHLALSKEQRSKLFQDINSGLNTVTGIRTRTQLKQKNFDTACDFIANWSPSVATLTVIKQMEDEVVEV